MLDRSFQALYGARRAGAQQGVIGTVMLVGLLSRMLGQDQAQAEYDEIATDPTTLFAALKVPMTGRAEKLHAPNRYASKAITRHIGAVVLSRDGLVVIVGRRLRCHATFSDSADPADAPLSITARHDGFTLDLDVAAALPPKGSGALKLDIRAAVPESALAQLPSHRLRAAVSPGDLLSMTRWV